MRLTAIFLLSACLAASARSGAQTIRLDVKGAPLEKVFAEIKKQTGYSFVYYKETLAKGEKITLRITSAHIDEVLQQVLKNQPLSYQIVDKTVIIARKEEDKLIFTAPPPIDVKGRIVNEKGEPVIASVQVKGANKGITTNDNGEFELKGVEDNAILVISGVSIETFEVKVNGRNELALHAKIKMAAMEEVNVVVNTGYQKLPRERATGSFGFVTNEQLNRKAGTDILSRLEGLTTGIQFDRRQMQPNQNGLGAKNLMIRGLSTLTEDIKAPLIVVDNFPYEGDINNINPNDVENITILKDAAAASIWGARAGNGVIVITTKRGQYDQPFKLSLNTNLQFTEKPDLFAYPKMTSSEYIDLEEFLFGKGYYDGALADPSYPAVSPVVEILARKRAGTITASEATAQINALRSLDVRNDFEKYIYRGGLNQQYAMNLSGGSTRAKYLISGGYDKSLSSLQGNDFRRITLRSVTTLQPVKDLEVNIGLAYTNSNTYNNSLGDMGGPNYNPRTGYLSPYAQFGDGNGTHLELAKDYRTGYTDTAGAGKLMDWKFRPLDEMHNLDNKSRLSDILVNAGIGYKLFSFLSVNLNYQFENSNGEVRNFYSDQTYYTRNMINLFTQIQGNNVTNVLRKAGILDQDHTELVAHMGRMQINVDKNWGALHHIHGIVGGEVRERKTTMETHRYYGFDPAKYTNATVDYLTNYPQYGNRGTSRFIERNNLYLTRDRFVSLYGNMAYEFKNRYILSASARQDAGNVFGIKANNRWKPLWTTGLAWIVDKESFYHSSLVTSLKLRASYGYQGNVNNSISPNTIISYALSNNVSNLPWAIITNGANPELSWESIGQFNIGLDFRIRQRINGSIDVYRKKTVNLLYNKPLDPTTGILRMIGNNASMKGNGVEVLLNSVNIRTAFEWNTEIGFTYSSSTVTDYSPIYDTKIPSYAYASSNGLAVVGRRGVTAYPIYSYQFAGLDPATGDPLGYLGKNTSKEYQAILNQIYDTAGLVFHGSSLPKYFGFLNNNFRYRDISLMVGLTYAFDYYFRKNTVNYYNLVRSGVAHADYSIRWKAPGDEKITNVPSFMYPLSNTYRDEFYAYSSANVFRGDHIRLQNIRLAYNLSRDKIKRLPFQSVQFYGNVENLGIIWRANAAGLDPDYNTGNALFPVPKRFTAGVQINL